MGPMWITLLWGLALLDTPGPGGGPPPPPPAAAPAREVHKPRRRGGPARRASLSPCAVDGVVCQGPPPLVALTFDDCFRTDEIGPLLQALEGAGARATFFCAGWVLEAHPEIARRIVAGGHELGNHTQHHRMVVLRRSLQEVEDELDGWQRTVDHALGQPYPTRWFRPPGMAGFTHGADPEVLEAVRRRGMRVALWTLDTYWSFLQRNEGAPAIAQALRRLRGGEIVLLHVDRADVAAVESALPDLAGRFRLVTLSEMFASSHP